MSVNNDERFEPVEKPVKWQEFLLCFITQFLTHLATQMHSPVAQTAALVSVAVLMGISLWLLLAPPRFSATRGSFILAGWFASYSSLTLSCGLLCLLLLHMPCTCDLKRALRPTPFSAGDQPAHLAPPSSRTSHARRRQEVWKTSRYRGPRRACDRGRATALVA